MSLKNFKPLLIALVLSLCVSFLINVLFPVMYSATWYISLLFNILISLLIQILLFRRTDDQQDYTFKIMFASMGRLLLCMIGLLVYKVFDKANFTQFAVHFMVHYILFTAFEIAYLLKYIKKQTHD